MEPIWGAKHGAQKRRALGISTGLARLNMVNFTVLRFPRNRTPTLFADGQAVEVLVFWDSNPLRMNYRPLIMANQAFCPRPVEIGRRAQGGGNLCWMGKGRQFESRANAPVANRLAMSRDKIIDLLRNQHRSAPHSLLSANLAQLCRNDISPCG